MAAEGLIRVRDRMLRAADRAGRDPAGVTLVAVCKGRSTEDVLAAYAAGQRDFGENRPEALAARLGETPSDIRWHLVGTVQRRKVKMVRSAVTLLHSLDRHHLADAWADGADAAPPVLIQVNAAREPQKHGYAPDEVPAAVAYAHDRGLTVVGLMTIPPAPQRPEDSRPWFEKLRELRDAVARDHPDCIELSMGMTDDFEVAIEEGATIIRVGRAIFEAEP